MDPVARSYQYLDEQAQAEVDNFEPRGLRFNPSSIAKCSRQLAYKGAGAIPEVSPGFLRLYSAPGDFFHDEVRCVMKDAGVEFAGLKFDMELRKVYEEDICKTTITHNGQSLFLSGRGDGQIKVDGRWLYSELKSVDAYKYMAMRRAYLKGEIVDFLFREWASYIGQCNMMCSPDMLDLPGTYLTIINRSNCQFGFTDKKYQNPEGGVYLPYDAGMWEQQKNKMAMIAQKLEDGDLPVRGEAEGSKGCQQCSYEKKCWG